MQKYHNTGHYRDSLCHHNYGPNYDNYESDEERPKKISKYDSELESGEENTNNEGSDEEWDKD